MKKKQIVLFIVVLVSLLIILFFVTRTNNTEEVGAYKCIYTEGGDQLRCITDTNNDVCYGYYSLRTDDVKDGIITDNNSSSTCEEFSTKNNVFFDENGNFLSKK